MLSKLCRLENEYNTALTLWEPVVAFAPEDFENSLQGAILNDDFLKVKESLAQGTTYVNDGDSNGVTPLHLSCSFLSNKPRLEITAHLLHFPEIDVSLPNFCGNTPFHYFVRFTISDSWLSKYLSIFDQFLLLNSKILGARNHKVTIPFFSFFTATPLVHSPFKNHILI